MQTKIQKNQISISSSQTLANYIKLCYFSSKVVIDVVKVLVEINGVTSDISNTLVDGIQQVVWSGKGSDLPLYSSEALVDHVQVLIQVN